MVFICQSFAKVLPFCNCLKGLFEAAPRKIYGLVKLLYYCPFYLNYLSLSITVGGYSRINPPFIVARMNKCFIFAPSSCRYLNSLIRVKVVGWGWHCGKAFTWRFGFDTLRTSQLLTINQKQSNSRCHGYVYYIQMLCCNCQWVVGNMAVWLYICISAWGLRCSFRLIG